MDPKITEDKEEAPAAVMSTSAAAPSGPGRSRQVSDEKSEARELWFKTVVKILKWKDPKNKNSGMEQISEKEWNAYYKETIKINTSSTKEKTLKKLKETEDLIKKNGGFAF